MFVSFSYKVCETRKGILRFPFFKYTIFSKHRYKSVQDQAELRYRSLQTATESGPREAGAVGGINSQIYLYFNLSAAAESPTA